MAKGWQSQWKLGQRVQVRIILHRADGSLRWAKRFLTKPVEGIVVGVRLKQDMRRDSEYDEYTGRTYRYTEFAGVAHPCVLVATDLRRNPLPCSPLGLRLL